MAVKREAAQAQEQRGFAPVRMLVESIASAYRSTAGEVRACRPGLETAELHRLQTLFWRWCLLSL
jgi:hypothetical protein